jgi:hypothetical protein
LTNNGYAYANYNLGGDDEVVAQADALCTGNYQNVTYPTDCKPAYAQNWRSDWWV